MLEKFGVDLQEGEFSYSLDSSPTHPFVISCRNMALNKDHLLDGVSTVSTGGQLEGRTPGQDSYHLEPSQAHSPPLPSPHQFEFLETAPRRSLVVSLVLLLSDSVHGIFNGDGLDELSVPSPIKPWWY
jgi:hypothetical protein